MTDPLSISAAAAGFVSLVLQAAQTATQFVQDAKSFPEEFKKLSLAINEFGVLVRRLTPVIEKVEARYEIEEGQNILKHCRDVLQDIKALFGPSNSVGGNDEDPKKFPLTQRIRWASFKKRKAAELVSQLEQCKSTLSLTFETELLLQMSEENERALQDRKVAAEDRQEAKQERMFAQNERDIKRRNDILDWLSSGDFRSRHENIGSSHVKGTGNWLITELQPWFNGNGPRVILCKGAGGVGKTYLTYGIIQNHINSSAREIGFAFTYFDHKETRKPAHYIASLLRQLEQQKQTLTNSVQKVYDELSPKCHRPDLLTLGDLLSASATSFKSRAYIVLDGLDECTEDCRVELLNILREVLVSPNSKLYIFIATRPHINTDILTLSLSGNIKMINVVAGEGPLNLDLQSFIDIELSEKRMDNEEKLCISRGIIKKAQGLFLLAGLHLKSVLEYRTTKKRERALASLPQGLNKAYEAEMKRIERAGKDDCETARRALAWVYFAKRPLRMKELREAIAIEPIEDIEDEDDDCRDLDPRSFTDPELIIQCCGGLLLWEQSTDIIRVSHYTVSEFFKDEGPKYIESELYISKACLTYLCFDVFNKMLCSDFVALESLAQKYRLAPYILRFCGKHILDSRRESSIKDLIVSILWSPVRRQALCKLGQDYDTFDYFKPWSYYRKYFADWTPLHFLAAWGLKDICNEVLSKSLNDMILYLETIRQKWRYRGAEIKDTFVWVKQDLDPNAKNTRGVMPLHYAAQFGHKEIVTLLLSHGADLAAKDRGKRTALYRAAERGHSDVVALLLSHGADVAVKDFWGKTPLFQAVLGGHGDVVGLLLSHGAAVKDSNQYMALHCAAELGHRDVVALLLNHGADVAEKDFFGSTALNRAVLRGHGDVVGLLLSHGAAVKNLNQWMGLHWAAERGHRDVVAQLLSHGADVAAKDFLGRTALHWAALGGHRDVVALLLSHGADVAAKDVKQLTAWHLAKLNGHTDVVALLKNKGA